MSSLKDGIAKAREAGFSDADIYSRLKSSDKYGQNIQSALDNDFDEAQIQERLFGQPIQSNQQQQEPEEEKGFFAQQAENLREATVLGTGRSLLSGATLGLTENIPALRRSEEEKKRGGISEGVGQLLPIGRLFKVLGVPFKAAQGLIRGTGIAATGTRSLINMGLAGSVGATVETVEELTAGKELSPNDILSSAAGWAALDGAFQVAAPLLTKFGGLLVDGVKKLDKPVWELIEKVTDGLKREGVLLTEEAMQDLIQNNPEAAENIAFKATELLEEQIAKSKAREGTRQLVADKKVRAPRGSESGKIAVATDRALLDVQKATEKPRTDPKKVDIQKFQEIEVPEVDKPPKPVNRKPERANLSEHVVTEVDKKAQRFAPKHETEKQFGEAVQISIDDAREVARKSYGPKYDKVNEIAKNIEAPAKRTAKVVEEGVLNLNRFKTKPPGFEASLNQLKKIIQDTGMIVESTEDGVITAVHPPKRGLSFADTVTFSKRVAELAEFGATEPSVKKIFNRVATTLKADAKASLSRHSPKVARLFESAENEFGLQAEKLGRESIRKIRHLEATEQVAKIIQQPTAYKDLKNVLSDADFKMVERELFDHFAEMPVDKIEKAVRQFRPDMTNEFRRLTDKLILEKQTNQFIEQVVKGKDFAFEKLDKLVSNPSRMGRIRAVGGEDAVNFLRNADKTQKTIVANLDTAIKNEAKAIERIEQQKVAKARAEVRAAKIEAKKARLQGATKEVTSKEQAANRAEQRLQQAEKGKKTLEKAATKRKRSENPILQWVDEKLSFMSLKNLNAVKSILGLGGLYASPQLGGGLILTKMIVSSPRVRRGINNLKNTPRTDTKAFVKNSIAFAKILEEEQEED